MRKEPHHEVIVVGAGISGLMCAKHLAQAGVDVSVIDKGRRVGGRMSTRHFKGAIFDHGAQFFSAKSPTFQTHVDRWKQENVVDIWFDSSADPAHPHPRYYGCKGMNSIPQYIATGLTISTSVTLTSIDYTDHWILQSADRTFSADHLILTPPGPQTYTLLASGKNSRG